MKTWLFPLALALAGAAHGAQDCETLRSGIEEKIGASGVQRFSVTVVDAAAPATGQVVGSCELGSKKIVYAREAGSAPAAAVPKSKGTPMWTECKDGTASVGGSCKN